MRHTIVFRLLEWITHAKVERGVLPLEVVYPSFAERLIGVVQTDTPIEAQNGKFDIYTKTYTRIEGQLFVEISEREYRACGVFDSVALDVPDVGGLSGNGTYGSGYL